MADLSQEHVVRIEQPERHFILLRAPNGDYVGVSKDGELATFDHVDDKAIWDQGSSSDACRHVVTGRTLTVEPASSDVGCRLREDGAFVSGDGTVSTDGAVFTIGHGPAHLPSEYLRTFNENGWVCLPAILSPEIVEELEKVSCTGRWSDRTYDRTKSPLNQTAAVAKTAAEPVSLWLIRRYLQTDDIRLAHAPSIVVLSKDDGKRDVQGWHSDFPYLWGITRRVGGGRIPTDTSGALAMGVQRNICISEFKKENGATCFKLGTHTLNAGPPSDWGIGSVYSQQGYREAHGLPYNGPEADTIEAPAGSIILYDARTWHRAGVNRTDEKRAAMLQAMIPMYLMPFNDTSKPYKDFVSSPLLAEINQREQKDIGELMVHKIVGPLGEHAISVDEELTGMTVR